jgi:peptidoglycan/xylan/chitin deacetylase (PgdA/CDA1 family)
MMKKTFSIFIVFLLLSLPSAAFAQVKVPILVYHSIDEYSGHGMKELYVTPENFEKQMMYLRDQGFTLLTFERWNEINQVRRPIFITFDDGYKNNLNAYQIFNKLKSDHFKPAATIFIISSFISRVNRLTNTDLKRLADSGSFSIQSHTATHPDLTKITDYKEELQGSKEKIEQITGKPVIALSYPYGNTNKQVIAETKKYYLYGLTTTPGPYVKTNIKDELYLLPRTYIKYSTTLEDFGNILKEK